MNIVQNSSNAHRTLTSACQGNNYNNGHMYRLMQYSNVYLHDAMSKGTFNNSTYDSAAMFGIGQTMIELIQTNMQFRNIATQDQINECLSQSVGQQWANASQAVDMLFGGSMNNMSQNNLPQNNVLTTIGGGQPNTPMGAFMASGGGNNFSGTTPRVNTHSHVTGPVVLKDYDTIETVPIKNTSTATAVVAPAPTVVPASQQAPMSLAFEGTEMNRDSHKLAYGGYDLDIPPKATAITKGIDMLAVAMPKSEEVLTDKSISFSSITHHGSSIRAVAKTVAIEALTKKATIYRAFGNVYSSFVSSTSAKSILERYAKISNIDSLVSEHDRMFKHIVTMSKVNNEETSKSLIDNFNLLMMLDNSFSRIVENVFDMYKDLFELSGIISYNLTDFCFSSDFDALLKDFRATAAGYNAIVDMIIDRVSYELCYYVSMSSDNKLFLPEEPRATHYVSNWYQASLFTYLNSSMMELGYKIPRNWCVLDEKVFNEFSRLMRTAVQQIAETDVHCPYMYFVTADMQIIQATKRGKEYLVKNITHTLA